MKGELIMGRHPVSEAIASGRDINKVWVSQNGQGLSKKQQQTLKENQVTIQFVPKNKLDQLVNSSQHQGVVASVAAHEYADMDELFSVANNRNEQPFFIILDGIEDPHNFGSILRTADAVGAHGVIIPKRRAVGLTPVVAKASTGAIEHVPVVRVTNLSRTIQQLKKQGLWFLGTDADGQADYKNAELDLPLCLVMGNEGSGMSRLVKEHCDFLIRIPMEGTVTSLNASVAAALLMYEVHRHRHSEGE